MVRELHCRGFEKLRIIPHIAPSGLHWRCEFLPRKAVLKRIGTQKSEIPFKYAFPYYTSGAEFNYFKWEDGKDLSLTQMAERFEEDFPELMADCRGSDKEYVEWFFKMIFSLTENDLPYFLSDCFSAYNYVPTTKGQQLLMPPRGDAQK
jgi:hypothetical protein